MEDREVEPSKWLLKIAEEGVVPYCKDRKKETENV